MATSPGFSERVQGEHHLRRRRELHHGVGVQGSGSGGRDDRSLPTYPGINANAIAVSAWIQPGLLPSYHSSANINEAVTPNAQVELKDLGIKDTRSGAACSRPTPLDSRNGLINEAVTGAAYRLLDGAHLAWHPTLTATWIA